MSESNRWLDEIDEQIRRKGLLDHPFYKAWTCGELSLESLRDYAVQYSKHVDAFPRYLSSLHAHTEDMAVRRHILENLNDEEAGSPNHPELWWQFAQGIGVDENELTTTDPQPETTNLIKHFLAACSQRSVAAGMAALYAYESQIPAVSRSKIDGLVEHYGVTSESVYEYFTVHEIADIEHSQVERELLGTLLNEENLEEVRATVAETLDRLYALLDGVSERHGIATAA